MFTSEETRDMYDVYLKNNRNSDMACASYRTLYPERTQLHRTIFARISRNLAVAGSFKKQDGNILKGLMILMCQLRLK